MKSIKSNSNHVAAAVMAVSALVGNYKALASQQASPSALISFLSVTDTRSPTSALEAEHRDAIKKLKICAATSAEANKYAINKGFPKHKLTDEQAKTLAIMMLGIRQVEADMRKTSAPIGLEALHSELLRALAEARSEVVVTFEMVRQIRGKPESIEGRIDMNGLKALADRSTHRLLELASA